MCEGFSYQEKVDNAVNEILDRADNLEISVQDVVFGLVLAHAQTLRDEQEESEAAEVAE